MLQENLVWVAIIGVVCALFCILVYIYIKDVETTKCFKQYEKSIDLLTRQNYQKDKKIKLLEEKIEKLEGGYTAHNLNSLSSNIREEVQASLNSTVSHIYEEVNKIISNVQEEKERTEERIMSLEEKIKEIGYFPTSPNGVDEERIISMFKDGWSVDSIAKELRIGKGEVEFTLKLANI